MAMQTDLRKQPVEDVLSHVENSLHLHLDPQTLVRKRRSLGARTNRGTWVRIEARPLAKIAAQGQVGDGIEAAARLYGIAKPTWSLRSLGTTHRARRSGAPMKSSWLLRPRLGLAGL
jgi:hypothetical protein